MYPYEFYRGSTRNYTLPNLRTGPPRIQSKLKPGIERFTRAAECPSNNHRNKSKQLRADPKTLSGWMNLRLRRPPIVVVLLPVATLVATAIKNDTFSHSASLARRGGDDASVRQGETRPDHFVLAGGKRF